MNTRVVGGNLLLHLHFLVAMCRFRQCKMVGLVYQILSHHFSAVGGSNDLSSIFILHECKLQIANLTCRHHGCDSLTHSLSNRPTERQLKMSCEVLRWKYWSRPPDTLYQESFAGWRCSVKIISPSIAGQHLILDHYRCFCDRPIDIISPSTTKPPILNCFPWWYWLYTAGGATQTRFIPLGHPEPLTRLVKVWVKDFATWQLCLHLGPRIKHQWDRLASCLKAWGTEDWGQLTNAQSI